MNITSNASGEPVVMPAASVWHFTGRQLRRGRCYRITGAISKGECYRDAVVRCTPEGPTGLLGAVQDSLARDASRWWNLFHWIGPGKVKHLRVLEDRDGRRASFLTLIAAIGEDDRKENVQVIGPDRTITAHANGELVVFANDWPGGAGDQGDARFENSKTYRNNHGALEITVTELADDDT